MLNSSNYASDKETINSGQVIAPEIDYKTPGLKIYYHVTPGAKTHMPDGAEIQFLGGQFATANDEIKVFLDKIADKKGSQVFTKQSDRLKIEAAIAATDAAAPAGDAKLMMEGQKPAIASPEMLEAVNKKDVPDILPGQEGAVRSVLKPGVVPAVPQK